MGEHTLLDDFRATFTGHDDTFVKHVLPFTEDDSGKLKGKFVGLAEYRSNSSMHPEPPEGFSDGDKIPLTKEWYGKHLDGEQGLAVSPLIGSFKREGKKINDVCLFGVIDIDVYGDEDFTPLVFRLNEFGYRFAAFISKSGGLHLYFLLQRAEKAAEVRKELGRIVEIFGLNKLYTTDKGKSRVEVFPEHDKRVPGMHDKAVFLPFFGATGTDPELRSSVRGKYMSMDGKIYGPNKAMPILRDSFTSLEDIKKATDALPYSEAPFCIQMLLISPALGQLSGRNEFMTTAGIYLKTKDKDAIKYEDFQEMNGRLLEPLEEDELERIFKSVSEKDYQLFGRCDKSPCSDVCDKQLCKLRTYGVGRTKKNEVSNVEFGKVYRVMTEVPYYLWEARLAGTEAYKTLRVDGAENFLNQRYIQRACIDALGQISVTVTIPTWEATVNGCLANIDDIPAPVETDTTDIADLRKNFYRYLTHQAARNANPYTVMLGQVYFEKDTYYFTDEGFKRFLDTRQFKLGKTNLREELIKYGAKEADLPFKTGRGSKKIIKCWGMLENEKLVEMTTFYEDIAEADVDVINTHKLNKQDTQADAASDDDQRF